ncbi:hypothetical protein [Hydrogenophaga sp. BPS33]|uniref:hypothetical protein n=1 Tax=Hydrogenophaga sp. BPS33 TaxID=2651974 RepID=UPI00131FC788|nr:hypothetical protein [Hydrogenophaga sp. BPS33]QHE84888.1 hypothetical protein F9K07_08310 [Hydrogenophaga sp. BPS33]
MKAFGVLVFAALMGSVATASAQTISANKLDIVGVKLGMTEAEVTSAIKAFDAGAKQVSRRMAHFPYSDGVNGFQTPAFLDEVEYRAGDSKFRVWFAAPPAEPRSYAIHRYSTGNKTPPTREQFSAALTSKYGPGQSHYLANTGSNVMQWSEQGKPECAVSTNARVVVDSSPDTLLPPRAVEVLEGLGRAQHPNLRKTMGASVDVARCGVVLRYVWGGPENNPTFPIPEFYVWLVDQGGMVAKNRQSMQWVKQLEADAARKRQGQGATPKL